MHSESVRAERLLRRNVREWHGHTIIHPDQHADEYAHPHSDEHSYHHPDKHADRDTYQHSRVPGRRVLYALAVRNRLLRR